MKLSQLSLLALVIKFESVASALTITNSSKRQWLRLCEKSGALVGFPMFLPHTSKPTREGKAWANIAYLVHVQAVNLRDVACGLESSWRRRSLDINLDDIEDVKKNTRMEKWLGLELLSDMGFMTVNGSVLMPQVEDLRSSISQLRKLESALRETRLQRA